MLCTINLREARSFDYHVRCVARPVELPGHRGLTSLALANFEYHSYVPAGFVSVAFGYMNGRWGGLCGRQTFGVGYIVGSHCYVYSSRRDARLRFERIQRIRADP
jgi:hypothetical protein